MPPRLAPGKTILTLVIPTRLVNELDKTKPSFIETRSGWIRELITHGLANRASLVWRSVIEDGDDVFITDHAYEPPATPVAPGPDPDIAGVREDFPDDSELVISPDGSMTIEKSRAPPESSLRRYGKLPPKHKPRET